MWKLRLVLVLWVAMFQACVIVPRTQRKYLSDPTMQASVDPLDERAQRKLHTSREGASGGDGRPAGGGCGCSN